MLRLALPRTGNLRLLLIGAHSDDIEIGCGGTVLSLLAAHPGSTVHWIVFSADPARRREAQASAESFLAEAARRDVRIREFRDGFMPFEGAAVKEYFESLKELPSPDLVFTHRLDDRHQDHRLLGDLTWNTFRSHLILEYEIPKYEGDLGQPNVFVPLTDAIARQKVELLMTQFDSQRSKRWFSEDLFSGLLRLRGIEAGGEGRYAEAFHARKLLVF